MDLLKALKKTTILSGMALLALGATEAKAANQTAILGHISASVVGDLTVKEVSAINFGNMVANGGCPVAPSIAAGTPAVNNILLGVAGERTLSGACLALTYGATGGGITGGVTNLGTGGQSPGFYQI